MQNQKNKKTHKSGTQRYYSSVQAFAKHLQDYPELLSFRNDDKEEISISIKHISSSSKTHHVLLYDLKLLEKFDEGNDLYVDGTFKVKPNVKGLQQVLTIMNKKFNTVRNF